MEVLLEQECSTERQLDTYKSQLVLVERQLECGVGAADTADLEQLKDNFTELIALTEDALLELKKQRLLFSVESVETGKMPTAEEKEGEEGDGEDSDDLRGIKCQAPIEESWGAVNYHNAVILCREDADTKTAGEGEKEDTKVRVLFTHPTYKAMRPCPFFLEGRCRFESSVCKFSHGHVVSFSDLLTYQEPDYSLASIGGKCLAKHSDSLWYPAIISSLDEEFTVHFPSLNTTVQTPIENVVPQEGSESSGSGVSSEEEEEAVVVEWIPSGPQRALGDWEKHTTGIGSKLMAKMGYVVGKGLGKSGEGRVQPVEIKILPAGKSLDVCAEMREKGKVRRAPGTEGESRRRRRRKRRKLVETDGVEEKRVDVFEFLNTKLQSKDTKAESQSVSKPKAGNLNVQLFTVQEEMKSVHKRRQSLQAQLARHKGRDKMMEEHVTEKLSAVDKELGRLQAEERQIEKSLKTKSERKKLRIF